MNAFNFRGVAFAAKCMVAAIAAVLAALWLDLPNPGWAGLTVFLVSQPLMGGAAGAVVARSVYRVIGTLLGAAGVLFVIPAFAGDPWLIVAIAAWVGSFLAISLLDRSPKAYAFLLAGYTLPLVGMPLANNPAGTFNVAVWRVEEILLGAAFSTLVHTLFVPRSLKPILLAKARATVDDARSWILKGLGPEPRGDGERKARERVAADLTEMRQLIAHLHFEPRISRQDFATALALEERLLELLPLLAGVEERLAAVGTLTQQPAALHLHLACVQGFITRPTTRDLALRLGEEGHALAGVSAAPLSYEQALLAGAMQRLAELIKAWHDGQALLARLEGQRVDDVQLDQVVAEASRRPLHVDPGLAVFSGLAAAMAVAIAGGLCWLLGWEQGGLGVGIAAAGSSLFAFADDPRPFLRVLLRWTVIAVPVAALYVFAIFPALSGPIELAAALAPLFFFTALYLATPSRSLAATGFALISQSLVSVQQVQGANFVAFADSALASVGGTMVALTVVSLVRVISAEVSVTRLLHAAWRDLAALASERVACSRTAWVSRRLDRLGLLLPRLGGVGGTTQARAKRALDDLRLGVNIVELRAAGEVAEPELRGSIELALERVGSHFRQRIERHEAAPEAQTLQALDRVVAELSESESGALRTRGLTAATGLRLSLSGAHP